MKCPHCARLLLGASRYCIVHGDQEDIGPEPSLELSRGQFDTRFTMRPCPVCRLLVNPHDFESHGWLHNDTQAVEQAEMELVG